MLARGFRLALLAGSTVLAGCLEEEAPTRGALRAIDDAGRLVALERPATRIVSLAPSSTATLVRLGVSGRLLARTGYDRDPAIAGLPVIANGSLAPSAERVVELAPDLVVVWGDPATRPLATRLAALGLSVYVSEPRTIADVLWTTRRLGRLVGEEARADSLIEAIRTRLATVKQVVERRSAPGVLFLVWTDPPFTTGPGTYADEVIRQAGGRNVFSDLHRPWGEVSLETILDRDPDWILAAKLPDTLAGTRWGSLSAVREGRVLTMDPDLLHRPGPGVAEAVERIARRLHPGAFP
jgi:ABC-type Fe3+-hydroxamate transport system substrate-binding protein